MSDSQDQHDAAVAAVAALISKLGKRIGTRQTFVLASGVRVTGTLTQFEMHQDQDQLIVWFRECEDPYFVTGLAPEVEGGGAPQIGSGR